MSTNGLWSTFLARFDRQRLPRARRKRAHWQAFAPAEIESLESRTLLSCTACLYEVNETNFDNLDFRITPQPIQIYVNTTQDGVNQRFTLTPGGDIDPTQPGNQVSLRSALQSANSHQGNDFIYLPAGDFNLTRHGMYEDYAATGDLDVRDNVTIIGQGPWQTIIDARDIDRVFQVLPGVSLVLRDLTVTNGDDSFGAGIYNEGRLTLDTVHVTNNVASFGGGIYNRYGNVSILNSSYIGENEADFSGGAIYNLGDEASQGSLTIDSSKLELNGAYWGGAIYNRYGDVQIVNGSKIWENTAEFGGGVFNNYGNSNVFVEDSEFWFNIARSHGGGVYNVGYLNLQGWAWFVDNVAGKHGGGLYNAFGGHVDMPGWAGFHNNRADYGGGLYNDGTMDIGSVRFIINTGYTQGGHIYQTARASMDRSNLQISIRDPNTGEWTVDVYYGLKTGLWIVD